MKVKWIKKVNPVSWRYYWILYDLYEFTFVGMGFWSDKWEVKTEPKFEDANVISWAYIEYPEPPKD